MTGTRRRTIAIGLAGALVGLIVLVALLPMMISAGLFHGTIRNAIERNVDGTARFGQLRVRWLGPQEITALTITDRTGRDAIVVDAQASASLFALIFGMRVVDASVTGVLRGDIHEDGTTSFQHLFITEERDPDEPLNLAGVPATHLRLAGITAHIHDVAAGQMYVLEDARGDLIYTPGDRVSIDLQAETEAADLRGSVVLTGHSTGLFNNAGRFTPENAPMDLELAIRNVPVPGMDVRSELHELNLTAHTENLGQLLALNVRADAAVQDEPPSRFRGAVRISMPFRPDGTLDLTLERIAGELSGERVPSSLLQPALAGTPIILRRDVGPSIDLEVLLDEETATIRAVGERAELDLVARQDEDGWWVGDQFRLVTAEAHPDLIHGLTQLTVQEPAALRIELTSFAVPPVHPQTDTRPLPLYAGAGTLAVESPVTFVFAVGEDEQVTARMDRGAVNFQSPALGEELLLDGDAEVEGAQVRFTERLTRLFDEAGELDIMNAEIVGELAVEDLPTALIARWMPEQEELVREALGNTVTATLVTDAVEAGIEARLSASSPTSEAELTALRRTDGLELLSGWLEATVTPDVLAAFQADVEEPVILAEPAVARLDITPREFPGATLSRIDSDLLAAPWSGRLTVREMVLQQVAGFDEAVGLRGFEADLTVQLTDPARYELAGRTTLLRPGQRTGLPQSGSREDRTIGIAQYDLTASPAAEAGEAWALSGSLDLTDLSIVDAERMMGQEAGAYSRWVGESGTVRATFAGEAGAYEATLVSETPRLRGAFDASLVEDLISLRSTNAELVLAAAALEEFFAAAEPGAVSVADDVPVQLLLDARMPWAMLVGEPVDDPMLVDISAQMSGGPLVMVSDGERTTLSRIDFNLRSEASSAGVDFILEFDAPMEAAPVAAAPGRQVAERPNSPGGMEVRGTLRDAVRAGQPPGLDAARLDLNATLNGVPTVFLDRLMSMGGYLAAAVGRHMDATVTASDLARNGGRLDVDISTEHGWLRGAATGSEGLLIVTDDAPVEAQLNIHPLLRTRVLPNIHPLLADIVGAAEPMRATMSEASLPLDGDVRRLAAAVLLNIGEVQFDRASPLFGVLALARVDTPTLAGVVEDVQVHVRDGVVSYDRFNVSINGLDLPYAGEIDLAERTVRLRTNAPLSALMVAVGVDLGRQADTLNVPLLVRGNLGEPLTTEIDPDFDLARAMAEAGLRRGLEELLPELPLPRGLEDLFPPRRNR